ncbi:MULTISPECIES: PAS domain-containing sensor histidine kinase [unclassified Roseitalea]|uniref:sensor histidine kinase NtrY-like n=1 Tax=unclassified Roseitalea TaxID=2639107 RepID=UPI00273F0DD0|nr:MULTISPECIES: PAS domain-containing sensor histidine kinase [unclassified Roseitalea]
MVSVEQGTARTAVARSVGADRISSIGGIVIVIAALITAGVSFVVLIGLTPIQPDNRVTTGAIAINGLFVAGLMWLIGIELHRILQARRTRKAASRLHVRIVAMFSLVATAPALAVAIVAAITLDLGLDRWFEIRTQTIVDSSIRVAESYVNENAINLRDATINMAFALDSQRILFSLDRTGFRSLLTQQARGRGMLGASVIRPDGTVIHSADIAVERPLPMPPADALEAAADGAPVIIPPGRTNLVGALIQLREIDNALLYTIRTVDAQALDAVRLMQQNRAEYQNLEANQGTLQLAFALLYFGLTLILLLAAIWTGLAVANRIVRPIRQLINASDEVGSGNLEVRVPVRSSDGDVGHLAETFNGMLGQLKSQRDEILRAKDVIDGRRRFSEAVLSGVSAGVLGLDDKGRISVANRSAAAILNEGAQIAPGTWLGDISPSVNRAFGEALAAARSDFRSQVTYADKTGRERVLNIQVKLDRKSEGSHRTHVVTVDDISELVDAQRTSAWADVARRIAHEIKNPLTPIQLSAERIKRRYGKVIADDDRQVFDQCTDTIIRQVGDIGRMVDEFSSFARMPKPAMSVQDLRETVREAAFLVEVSRSDIQFERQLPDEPLTALFDDRLVGQAVGNIVKNASEAIEARLASHDNGSVAGHVLVRAGRSADGEHIHVDVLDNGRGLPRQHRNKLLEPYMTTREKGTGLGLAIVRKIMEDHGGALELHDAPPDFHGAMGAMVRLSFPVPETTGRAADDDGRTDTGQEPVRETGHAPTETTP